MKQTSKYSISVSSIRKSQIEFYIANNQPYNYKPMFILLFLNFYLGENIKEEPSLAYDLIKIFLTATIAAAFTYTGFRIRDWLDRKKELVKMNVTFINLYEELKQLNKGT